MELVLLHHERNPDRSLMTDCDGQLGMGMGQGHGHGPGLAELWPLNYYEAREAVNARSVRQKFSAYWSVIRFQKRCPISL